MDELEPIIQSEVSQKEKHLNARAAVGKITSFCPNTVEGDKLNSSSKKSKAFQLKKYSGTNSKQ